MRGPATFLVWGVVLVAACDDEKKGAPPSRREGVVATASTQAALPIAPPSASLGHVAPSKPLCDGQWTDRPFARPSVVEMSRDGALGKPVLWKPPSGKWTWLNLFASWCGPCKEEIPRLRRWEKQGTFSLTFISLDDDERELRKFLLTPLGAEVSAPIWLKEDRAREKWLLDAQIKNPPNLPVQVLIDPAGKVRCVSSGAVEESDWAVVRERLR